MALASLPEPADKRIAVRLTRDAERHVRAGHPWVFDRSVVSVSHDGAPGDLAVVFDRRRRFLAIGFYDPKSPIRIRILAAGSPVAIDEDFWLDRLDAAAGIRASLEASSDTTAYRLVNGENDGFGGLVIDRYEDVLVVKLYTVAWLAHLRDLVPVISAHTGAEHIVLRVSRNISALLPPGIGDGTALAGVAPSAPVRFLENGLTFEADVVRGQKTGHFLDQRDNRALVGGLASGARVLDVFSCTGGFSVHAAAGGATEVLSVDQSRPALRAVARHLDLNRSDPAVAACRHSAVASDAFAVLADLADAGEQFDMVVLDPPAFAQRQADVGRALAAYGRLTDLALDLVRDGDWLVQASCSARVGVDDFRSAIGDVASRRGMRLDEVMVTEHPVDHPVTFAEGAYLKAVFARPRAAPSEGAPAHLRVSR